MYRMFKGFIEHGNEPLGPTLYLISFAFPVDQARVALFAVEIIISDTIMVRVAHRAHTPLTSDLDIFQIYRLWTVWKHNWYIVVVPTALYLGLIGKPHTIQSTEILAY